jgi:hypothetical protein
MFQCNNNNAYTLITQYSAIITHRTKMDAYGAQVDRNDVNGNQHGRDALAQHEEEFRNYALQNSGFQLLDRAVHCYAHLLHDGASAETLAPAMATAAALLAVLKATKVVQADDRLARAAEERRVADENEALIEQQLRELNTNAKGNPKSDRYRYRYYGCGITVRGAWTPLFLGPGKGGNAATARVFYRTRGGTNVTVTDKYPVDKAQV